MAINTKSDLRHAVVSTASGKTLAVKVGWEKWLKKIKKILSTCFQSLHALLFKSRQRFRGIDLFFTKFKSPVNVSCQIQLLSLLKIYSPSWRLYSWWSINLLFIIWISQFTIEEGAWRRGRGYLCKLMQLHTF